MRTYSNIDIVPKYIAILGHLVPLQINRGVNELSDSNMHSGFLNFHT